jgi:hypothetical protein
LNEVSYCFFFGAAANLRYFHHLFTPPLALAGQSLAEDTALAIDTALALAIYARLARGRQNKSVTPVVVGQRPKKDQGPNYLFNIFWFKNIFLF